MFAAHHIGGALLHRRIDRREGAADRDAVDALIAQRTRGGGDLVLVERGYLAAVDLIAAGQQEDIAADAVDQFGRPAGQRRQRFARGAGEPQYADAVDRLALDQRIGEMGGADHHRIDAARLRAGLIEHRADRRHHPRIDVRRGRLLGPRQNLATLHQHRIGVGPPNVDTDPHSTTLQTARQRPRAKGPHRPRAIRKTGADHPERVSFAPLAGKRPCALEPAPGVT